MPTDAVLTFEQAQALENLLEIRAFAGVIIRFAAFVKENAHTFTAAEIEATAKFLENVTAFNKSALAQLEGKQ